MKMRLERRAASLIPGRRGPGEIVMDQDVEPVCSHARHVPQWHLLVGTQLLS